MDAKRTAEQSMKQIMSGDFTAAKSNVKSSDLKAQTDLHCMSCARLTSKEAIRGAGQYVKKGQNNGGQYPIQYSLCTNCHDALTLVSS